MSVRQVQTPFNAATLMKFRIGTANGVQLFGATGTTQFGGGVDVLGIQAATLDPTTNPSLGGILYVANADSSLKYRGPSGTVTTLAPG